MKKYICGMSKICGDKRDCSHREPHSADMWCNIPCPKQFGAKEKSFCVEYEEFEIVIPREIFQI